MADTKPNPYIVKWNLFTCYLNSPPFGHAAFGSTPVGRAISHFNQYSLVDPSCGNIPSWVWQGVSHWFRKLRREFDTTVILETEFHENNNSSISHPDKHKRNWKIVSTINVTYAPIQINWARNIASNYFSQQQPGSSFTTVSNVMVLLCELRHQLCCTTFTEMC